jgi:hypothetical protein
MSVVPVVIAAIPAVRKLSAAASQISAAHCANSAIADPAAADVRPITTATDMHPTATADAAEMNPTATANAAAMYRTATADTADVHSAAAAEMHPTATADAADMHPTAAADPRREGRACNS